MTVMSSTADPATVTAAKPKRRRDPMLWVIKPIVWALCLAPLAWLGWLATDTFVFGGRGLSANPVEFINLRGIVKHWFGEMLGYFGDKNL